MLPSVLSSQIRQGIEDFLRTTFPVATPFFHGIIDRLIAQETELFRGPYLSLKLPFRPGGIGRDFFPAFPMKFAPYLHQEQAFRRLSGANARSTIVATGTGSGKTECFLYPILQHCYEHRGEPGIKAILIYPMNALANDQAKRLARLIHGSPNLWGNVTAGLFVGQEEEHPSQAMQPDKIITDKNTLRLRPPDILLTNYKMLDYLLIRPGDYPLWKENRPETLKYLVVDELHTFDGAQGTDLACLLRRLKARLKTPPGFLCCVGTSATLGGESGFAALLNYAREIFGEPFDEAAVIGETLLSGEEFLQGYETRYRQVVPAEQLPQLQPESYPGMGDFLKAQHRLWFGEAVAEADEEWAAALPEKLKQHGFFRALILALDNRPAAYPQLLEILQSLAPGIAGGGREYPAALLNSFLALVSAARARREGELRPFLEVRVQLWLRELRRIVADVKTPPEIRFSDDLKAEQLQQHLPLVHCRECGAMGWGASKRAQDFHLNPDLQSFYQNFFRRNPTLCFVFPLPPGQPAEPKREYLCGHCLHLTAAAAPCGCANCGREDRMIPVWIANERKTVGEHQKVFPNCPYCGARNGLTIAGSRAASLLSVAIGQLFASPYNDDKKLLAFSDSVQDASHRAGFFGARTYRFNFRSAIQQFIERQPGELTLEALPEKFIEYWKGQWDERKFIAAFLPPDMNWLEDYEYLLTHHKLPADSTLMEEVSRRISWEIFAEYGFSARIGRTLEKTGSSAAYPDPARLERAAQAALEPLQNEIGELRALDADTLKKFLRGVIAQLRTRGGIFHPALEDYIESLGNYYRITQLSYMPNFGKLSRTPAFLTGKFGLERFDTLLSRNPTWYQHWAVKSFLPVSALLDAYLEQVYRITLDALVSAGLFRREEHRGAPVWGVEPSALLISREVRQFRCNECGHQLSAAASEAPGWGQSACLRFNCTGRYVEEPWREDYYRRLYAAGDIERIFAEEHTGLLARNVRESLEGRFEKREHPWDPNLLSCTPTLEMGVDIGDLSTVLLCSVPPGPANHIQRSGRSGRRDGNAFNLTVAAARNHDLYFYSEPLQMLAGAVQPPGCFLNAPAVLERQFIAFCFDRWIESGVEAAAIPPTLGGVLNNLDHKDREQLFPQNFRGFIDRRRASLLDQFMGIFSGSLQAEAREHLRAFVEGGESQEGSLSYRLIRAFTDVSQERKSLRDKVRSLTRRIQEMEKNPAKDKNYPEDLEILRREKSALNEIIKTINDKNTYNFFSDEGLLPNYAFPEAGVLLRSVIFRRKKKPDAQGKYKTTVYEYERPAVSAIHELAPANRFYAEGRRVAIDQVDLNLSELEAWRFCNNCSQLAREITNQKKAACPACGSPLWADEGQKRNMIRMRQVIATTPDKDSRSRDEEDDREPEFYNKQLLVEVDEKHVQAAYRIDAEDLPFGFEFLSKATLREINFGKRESSGEMLDIAGQQVPKNGFEICRECGKVQENSDKPQHAVNCRYYKSDSGKPITACVYLYREFASEAFRILIPSLSEVDSTGVLHSFMAALFLGLKRHFRGNIDHLRTALQREPLPDSAHHKKYLLLYDQVPGGTGYLKELMRPDLPLLRVFEEALQALKACDCENEGKDGCYRCLLAYRFSYEMADISRKTAIDLLSKILRHKERFVKIESVSKISVNTLVESELEERFLEALQRARTPELPLTLKKQLVNGKPGWYLKVNELGYRIEPQVELGSAENVAVPSRADFLFYPERGKTALPLAVFTDGFMYHADKSGRSSRIGRDLAQRMAIVRSGRFWTWSLTWEDIEAKFNPKSNQHFDNYLVNDREKRQQYLKMYEALYRVMKLGQVHNLNSFDMLIHYLKEPGAQMWQAYAFIQWLLLLQSRLVTIEAAASEEVEKIIRDTAPPGQLKLPELRPAPGGDYIGGFEARSFPDGAPLVWLYASGRKEQVQKSDLGKVNLTARLFDDPEFLLRKEFHPAWNGFLRLYNLYQFLPGSFFITSQGLFNNEYAGLAPEEAALEKDTLIQNHRNLAGLKEITAPGVHPLLDFIARENLPAPEAGYEWCNEHGAIVATAELAWPQQKLALLSDTENIFEGIFTAGGWRVGFITGALQNPGSLIGLLAMPERIE